MFDGKTYNKGLDLKRLSTQLERVRTLMIDGQFRGLFDIVDMCGGTTASISARLRDLRKAKFGSYVVNKRRVGEGKSGYYEYQLLKGE